jgi:hypothetical protein
MISPKPRARDLGIAGIQIHVVQGEDNTAGMLKKLWKDLGNFMGKFSIYQNDIHKGELFKSLGPLVLHKKIKG